MENTIALLENRTVRELGAVAHCYGLPFNNRQPKPRILTRLSDQLRAGQHLRRAYRTLSAEERDALRALQAAGGTIRRDQFTRDFGVIRPYRPWDVELPRQPWKQAASIAEKLWYGAFIELHGACVALSDESLPLLPPLPPLPPLHPLPALSVDEPSSPDALLTDMALFLGMLTRQRVRLIRGRQLAPRDFRVINAHLPRPEPEVDHARSERQIGRVRWLHYLAACARLVDEVNGALKPSLLAWEWLNAPPDERWRRLNSAIRQDLEQRVPLWESYHLPRVSLAVWDALIRGLDTLPINAAYGVRVFLRTLRIQCPGLIAEEVRALLAEPLTWLGQVMLSADGKQFAHCASSVPTLAVEQPGHWTLHESGIDIHLGVVPRLRPLVETLGWIGLLGSSVHTLRIDAEAVQRALRTGLDRLQIADAVMRLTGTSLSQAAFDQISIWANHADQLRIEHADLLYAADSTLLSSLYADRRLRTLLDKPISPHHAVIHAGMREPLDQHLQRRGYRAQSDIPDAPASSNVAHSVASDMAASAWLAMRVYQSLGTLVPQTLPIPGAVSDELKAALSADQRDHLEQAASQLMESIRQAIRGNVSMFTPSPLAQDDPDAISGGD